MLHLVGCDAELGTVLFSILSVYFEKINAVCFPRRYFPVTFALTNYEELRTPHSTVSIRQGFGNSISSQNYIQYISNNLAVFRGYLKRQQKKQKHREA